MLLLARLWHQKQLKSSSCGIHPARRGYRELDHRRLLALAVVAWTSPVADGAIVLVPSTRTGCNANVICTVSAFIKIHAFDNAVLDIKQFFA